jgi:isoquinoline 1-oxidoreductase beta subunit
MILDRLTPPEADATLSRRGFLSVGAALGGGLLIGVGLGAAPSTADAAGPTLAPWAPNAFVRIAPMAR